MTTVTKNRNFLKWQKILNIDNYEITFILKKSHLQISSSETNDQIIPNLDRIKRA
jgi:hypothetical protein